MSLLLLYNNSILTSAIYINIDSFFIMPLLQQTSCVGLKSNGVEYEKISSDHWREFWYW